MSNGLFRGLHTSCSLLCAGSVRTLHAVTPGCVAGLPLLLQPFTNLRSFSSAASGTEHLRDFAIIAHVDHGKTTLMDRLLSQTGNTLAGDRVMDSNALEKERGITISSKYTSFGYKGFTINAVDTPGHADFGGEVERILGMVDGALLLVDANEGPLSQTKFVLEKALKRGLKPVVVLNKVMLASMRQLHRALVYNLPCCQCCLCCCNGCLWCLAWFQLPSVFLKLMLHVGRFSDVLNSMISSRFTLRACDDLRACLLCQVDRPSVTEQQCNEVQSNLFDLFAHLGATDDQLDFTTLYASAREGWASKELCVGQTPENPSMAPLLDAILEHVPPPPGDPQGRFAMLVTMTERDSFLGRVATGRIASGQVKVGDKIKVLRHSGAAGGGDSKVTKIFKRSGVGKLELDSASAGDVISMTGAAAAGIADTIGAVDLAAALSPGPIEPPTLSMIFGPNDSPLAGREGAHLTGSKIGERLNAEAETSVSLRVLPVDGGGESFEVQARGELQLGLLIENMRREGYELSVSPPVVVYRMVNGQRMEPLEEVVCEIEDEFSGPIIDALSLRRGELLEMKPIEVEGKQRLTFVAPSRGLIGFRSLFATLTRGSGMLHRAFQSYGHYKGPLDKVRKGVLISMAGGKTTTHALGLLEPRGVLFTGIQQEVYNGMIIGECSRDGEMEVNPVREKKLTNVRNTGSEEKVSLSPARVFTLEDAIGYVAEDELIEVTPSKIRLRKRMLDSSTRKSLKRKAA
ncbi:MAG: elongation factor family [Trebouxia sp. A1-2]|nr:MAG: elongation factor family [Trebouxia sp. A1-2]